MNITKRTLTTAFLSLVLLSLASAQEALKAGTYYIQNKETGTFLSSGATWGTRGILDKHGIDFNVTTEGSGYKLGTQIQATGNALRPSDGYMDQSGTWTITPLADGCYAMYNGSRYYGYVSSDAHPWVPRIDTYTSTTSDATHWRFLTREDLEATLQDATLDRPVDATFYIQAPNFLIGDQRIVVSKVWGDDLTATGGNTSGSSYVLNNSNGEKYDTKTFDIFQTLTHLPNGVYSLSAQAFYRNGSYSGAATKRKNGTEEILVELYAGTRSTPIHSIFDGAPSSTRDGWTTQTTSGYVPDSQTDAATCFNTSSTTYRTQLTNIVVTDGTLRIGIRKKSKAVQYDWTCFDTFTLLYHGKDLTIMKESLLATLSEYASRDTTHNETYAQTLDDIRIAINNATTTDALDEASTRIQQAYTTLISTTEPDTTPLDLTNLLANPSLKDGLLGWTPQVVNTEGFTTHWTANTANNTAVVETYAGLSDQEMKAFSLTQQITLAPGMYRLSGQAFYRYGTTYNSDLNADNTPRSLAYLVAGMDSTRIMRLGDITTTTYANSMDEAAEAFGQGLYPNTLIFKLSQPTTIDLGYRGTFDRNRSWFAAGPVKLEKINDKILAIEAGDQFAETRLEYATRWQGWKAITDQALDHSNYDQLFDSIMATLPITINELELKEKEHTLRLALKHLLETQPTTTGQYDMTILISNPTLDNDLEGWTSQNAIVWHSAGLTEEFNVNTGRITQKLTDMPRGQYTLKVQALYRPTSAGTSTRNYEAGDRASQASLFLDNASVNVHNINDDSRYVSYSKSDVAGAFDRSIPNTINGASAAFKAGQYWNILRTEKTADGDMTIGLRIANGAANNWLAFDNFRLYYGAPTQDINLADNDKYTISEDTYANVTTNITLKANQLNAICLPFDMPTDAFEAVYTLGGVDYDAEANTAQGFLVPAYEVKAGRTYFVRVDADRLLTADDVILHAALPDSIPATWENGAMIGWYGKQNVMNKTYLLNDNNELQYKTITTNLRGYTGGMRTNLPTSVKTIPLVEFDYDNFDLALNIENQRARAFLSNVTYNNSSDPSAIEAFNAGPPSRRDQPHTAHIPLRHKAMAPVTIEVSTHADMSDSYKYTAKVGASEVEVANFIPGLTYYVKATSGGEILAKGRIRTEGNLRMIKFPSGNNWRDLGGWLTCDGNRLNYGKVYRSGELNGGHAMNETDLAEARRLGIGAELDLRQDVDIQDFNISTSAFGTNVPYLYVNQSMFGDDALKGDTAKYRAAFHFIITNLRAGRAVNFHCIWGADRTGAMAFLLEGLCGVKNDQMYKDYELTTYSNAGLRKKDGLDSKFSYINTIVGSTIQYKFFNYWRNVVNVPEGDLLDFITIMTNGQSKLVTAINEVTTDDNASAASNLPVYNLHGQRMGDNSTLHTLPKGIYIVGGKKVKN